MKIHHGFVKGGVKNIMGPRGHEIAKLVQLTQITMVYDTQTYNFHGGYKPIYKWGYPLLN